MRELNTSEVSMVSGGCVSDVVCKDPSIKLVAFATEDWTYEEYMGEFGPGKILRLEQSITISLGVEC